MNAKSLGAVGAVVVLSTIAVRFGPPDPRASWVPGPLSQLLLALEDSFDRYDGIGVPCSDRTPRPVTVGGHAAEVPSCWKVDSAAAGATITDPDLNAMALTVRVTAIAHSISAASVTTSVAEKAQALVPSDERVWVWSNGASEVLASVVVPRIVSLAPKVRTHLESIDAAVRSLR